MDETSAAAPGAAALGPAALKQCCADFYGSDLARNLFGESFHPGGLALTHQLGAQLRLGATSHLLDVACGSGGSALHLAETFGCQVLGVDLSVRNIAEAAAWAEQRGLADRVRFARMDAEQLESASGSFDALLCECALCTFPDKYVATREFFRVLRAGGRVAISDLTRVAEPLPQLQGLLAWVACIADARPLEYYAACLQQAGFDELHTQERSDCLAELVRQVRTRLAVVEVLIGLGKLPAPSVDLGQGRALLAAAAEAVRQRQLGYAVLIARKP